MQFVCVHTPSKVRTSSCVFSLNDGLGAGKQKTVVLAASIDGTTGTVGSCRQSCPFLRASTHTGWLTLEMQSFFEKIIWQQTALKRDKQLITKTLNEVIAEKGSRKTKKKKKAIKSTPAPLSFCSFCHHFKCFDCAKVGILFKIGFGRFSNGAFATSSR